MNTKLRVLVIDDEELARELLVSYLQDCPQLEVIGECENGFDGVKKINELRPDLIFLDVQMPKLTGFELLQLIDFKPEVVFTTAYDEYALKAFEHHAADYLLKPFSHDRLLKAVDKVVLDLQQGRDNVGESVQIGMDYAAAEPLKRIVVKDRHKIAVIACSEIHYIEALDDYVMIYTGNQKHMKQATMKFFETNLNPDDFIRIHRSYIVNIAEIAGLQQYEKESYLLFLKDGAKLKVSKSGYRKLKEILDF